MADSVGQIGLDLVVNQQGFNKQMQGITGLAKKAGAALAAAFAVKKIIDFGKSAIDLGSDLNEVQNVVDVTFTSMSAKVDEFAKKAATSFGLSETMAKQYTGTFGAMAKAFGFTEGAAYDMSTTLTGLAGDVASFYNLSQDEAYTKLKSVFTGETESLKDLGVVMTQAALDQYALANGYGKTTAKMSEGEKVALRYAFVTKQLSLASGDFLRTSGGWANQMRVLSLQFQSFKATIGQGLINLFTPVIKVINILLGKLMTLANAFKSFTELITGNKASDQTSNAISSIGAVAADAADNISGMGDAATKSAKKAKDAQKAFTNFDQVNVLSDNSNSDDGTGAGGSAGSGTGSAVDFGKLAEGNTVIDSASSKFQGLIDKARELGDIFKQGFKIGFGDADFSKVIASIDSIKKSVIDIFTAPEVMTSASKWADAVVLSFGKITGSAANIGVTLATLLTGSVAGYLDQNAGFIKDKIAGMLDISSKAAEIYGDFAVAIADIFTVFKSPAAIQMGTDLVSIFANSFLSTQELSLRYGTDLLNAMTDPIIENKDKIKTALENTLAPIETIIGGIKDFVDSAFQSINNSYSTYIAPAITLFSNGFSTIFSTLLDNYNTYLAPVLQNIADKFSTLITQHINPLVTAFSDLAGGIVLAIAKIWNETLAPFIAWVIDNLAPPFSTALDKISGLFMGIAAVIADVITKALEKLGAFTTWIGNNQETIVGITTVIGAFFAAWETVKLMAFIQQSGGVVSALSSLIAPLTTTTTAILANAGAFVTNTAAKIADKAETVILTAMYAKDFVTSLASGTAALVKQAAQWVTNTAMKVADTVATIASTAATVAATAATWLFNAALAVLTSPITLVVAAIGGLIAVGVLLYKNWDDISAWASKAWGNIKAVIQKAIDKVIGFFQEVIDFAKKNWAGLLLLIVNPFAGAFKLLYDNCETFRTFIDGFVKAIGDFFKGLWTGIQSTFSNVGSWFKTKFTEAWTNIKTAFNGAKSWFNDRYDDITGVFSNIVSWFETKFDSAYSAVKTAFSPFKDFFDGLGTSLQSTFKGAINSVISQFNKFIGWINSKLNFSWDGLKIAGKTIFEGGNVQLAKIPSIPALAQGGYVKANTPRLAIVGDNRREGEIVAPESKLQQMALDVARLVGSGGGLTEAALYRVMSRVFQEYMHIYIGEEDLARHVNRGNQMIDLRNSPVKGGGY